MQPYPIQFQPILKPKVWGGRSLEALGKRLPADVRIGESWEFADLPQLGEQGQSVISTGELQGLTLHQAIERNFDSIMGDARRSESTGGFPLLIKFLDAQEDLSVQVHPDQAYAAAHAGSHLKSEMWVVINAKPGAVIYKGIKPNVTAAEFAEHIRSGEVVRDLIAVPVQAGDAHSLPSGTCHALGAGVVVAEIQTPSDTTFRVYDWGRSGPGRELHIDQALECIRFGPQPPIPHKPHKPIEVDGIRTTPLLSTDHFSVERVDALTNAEFRIVTSGLPEIWMMLAGSGRILAQDVPMTDLSAGSTVLIPAALNNARAQLRNGAWLLRVKLPSPLKGLIA